MDPSRQVRAENKEQPIHPIYSYAFVTDREEGLVVVGPLATLFDENPTNNLLNRAATFNENGVLNGTTSMALAGTTGYVTTPSGLVVLDLDNPLLTPSRTFAVWIRAFAAAEAQSRKLE